MLSNNDNIMSRFLKAMAAFWNRASQYQIFVILPAIVMLVILPLFSAKISGDTNAISNIIIFCALAVAGFLLFKLKGSQMAAFTFAAALLVRLCLVLVLENSAPFMQDDVRVRTSPWIRHYGTVLFDADEFFYVYQGQRYSDMTIGEFINSPEFADHAHRAGFLFSRLLRFFGNEFIWQRLIGVFLGVFAAAVICLTAEEFFNKETAATVSLLAALAPQTVFYSVRILKEIWIVFAASMMIFGFMMIIRNKKLFWAALSIATAAIIFAWFRVEYSLLFIAALPVAICFRRRSSSVGRIIAIAPMILLGVIILYYQFNQLTQKAESMLAKYTLRERGERGKPESIEILDRIYQSNGPLRLLNIPLALLNPPPKNLHLIYTAENGFYDLVQKADIYQWWLPLPFLVIGAYIIIIRRTELWAFLLSYIIVISISALLLGGLHGGVLRYRDSLAPVAFIIIGAGIEDFIALPRGWKNRIIMAVYAVFVVYACLYYWLFIFT